MSIDLQATVKETTELLVAMNKAKGNLCKSCTRPIDHTCGTFEDYTRCTSCIITGWVKVQVPARYREAKLTDFQPTTAEALVGLWDEGGIIWGEPGVGKTHALWALVIESYKTQGQVRQVFRWSDLVMRHRGVFQFQAHESEDAIAKDLAARSLLIVDDLCDEGVDLSPSMTTFFVSLVDRVYEQKARFVISTNFDPEDKNGKLRQKLGHKVVDRLLHGHQVVELSGKNRRS